MDTDTRCRRDDTGDDFCAHRVAAWLELGSARRGAAQLGGGSGAPTRAASSRTPLGIAESGQHSDSLHPIHPPLRTRSEVTRRTTRVPSINPSAPSRRVPIKETDPTGLQAVVNAGPAGSECLRDHRSVGLRIDSRAVISALYSAARGDKEFGYRRDNRCCKSFLFFFSFSFLRQRRIGRFAGSAV